jgi:hypothetical protein
MHFTRREERACCGTGRRKINLLASQSGFENPVENRLIFGKTEKIGLDWFIEN